MPDWVYTKGSIIPEESSRARSERAQIHEIKMLVINSCAVEEPKCIRAYVALLSSGSSNYGSHLIT